MHKPKWYKENKILLINAQTCGINKDGQEQYAVDTKTGIRSKNDINDSLSLACNIIHAGSTNHDSISFVDEDLILSRLIFIPKYYDTSYNIDITELTQNDPFLEARTLHDLQHEGLIEISRGHGSPSADQRVGEAIPYIKVSDLRAGAININPTNMIPMPLAISIWKSNVSKLKKYDLISPERASKNIGEFCILMPGQEQIVLTKEVIIIRVTPKAIFSQFYLMWALSLAAVRKQWERIIFMQTNREDVGKRIYEIKLPIATNKDYADTLASPFKQYYTDQEKIRANFIASITKSPFSHHIHLGDISSRDEQ